MMILKMDNNNPDNLSKHSLSKCGRDAVPRTRRRGKNLETAILRAVWDELSQVGYTQLTVEGIAARAKTNKAVLYRRWENKSQLVFAAIQELIVPQFHHEIPDNGDLRKDVFELLHGIADFLQMIGAETINGLMIDCYGDRLIASLPQKMHPEQGGKLAMAMTAILRNAELRGEIDLGQISPRIISLPTDLLRHEFITTQAPISDKVINEIVDDIFIPLIQNK